MHGDKDLHHLKLLSIAYYVVAVLVALYAAYSVWSLVSYLGFLTRRSDIGGGVRVFDLSYAIWYFGWTCYWCALAPCMILASKKIQSQTSFNFCWMVAIWSCTFVPFGSALGAMTLIVLRRESVKSLFALPLVDREASHKPISVIAAFRSLRDSLHWSFGEAELELGSFLYQCPKTAPVDIYDTKIGGWANRIYSWTIIAGVSSVVSILVTYPVFQLLGLPKGSPIMLWVMVGGWLLAFVYGIETFTAERRPWVLNVREEHFGRSPVNGLSLIVSAIVVFGPFFLFESLGLQMHWIIIPLFFGVWLLVHSVMLVILSAEPQTVVSQTWGYWELNVHEQGIELKSPLVNLRARFDQIYNMHFGIDEVSYTAEMLLEPLYYRFLKNARENVLTIHMVNGNVFRIKNAKAVFPEDSVNAIIQRVWLTRQMPKPSAIPPRIIGAMRNSKQP